VSSSSSPPKSKNPQHKLPGSPLQRSPQDEDRSQNRNHDRPLVRVSQQEHPDSPINLNESIDEEGSLTGGAGVFEFGSGNDGTYDGDEDFELSDKVNVDIQDDMFDNNDENVDYGSDDGKVEKLSDAALSPDSFTRKYGKDTPPGSPGTSKANASVDSRDNVAYGSDFEEDIAEDFEDDFEALEEGEDTGKQRSVRFKPKPVSDIFITRDKYTADEVRELFYTHDEALQFSMDYSKEMHRAEMDGQSWYDWWESRSEAQWGRDDAENEKLSAWSDDELETGEYSFDEEIEGSNEFSRF